MCAAVVGVVWAVAWGLVQVSRAAGSDFAEHEAEIDAASRDLNARIAGGCRQRVEPPQNQQGKPT